MESKGCRYDGERVPGHAGKIHERIDGQLAPGEERAGRIEF
jgi:hypothetical protein